VTRETKVPRTGEQLADWFEENPDATGGPGDIYDQMKAYLGLAGVQKVWDEGCRIFDERHAED
jgi:hypothetical protein